MPVFDTKVSKYKKKRGIKAEWKTFRKGLNTLLRPTELGRDELAQADNIMLIGSGVPTGRWGIEKYFTCNATGSIRTLATFEKTGTDEIIALSDEGYLAKKNDSGSTVLTGQSYPSGTTVRSEQLGGETYFVSEDVSLTSYDGIDLSVFATISAPTGLYATNFSGATGPDSVSYKVTALAPNGGVTTPSDNYLLEELPNDLTNTQIQLFWTAPSAASLSGYEIYRGRQGDETWLAGIGPDATSYIDEGGIASATILAPLTNTTGGVKSKFLVKYKNRFLAVDKDDPSKLLVSGQYPYHTSFSWIDGGGYVYIDPGSGDDITGIAIQPIADRIVIYKNNASYLVELSSLSIGNYYILDPQYKPISTAVGCSSHDTIATVENDTFYFGRDGVYVTGYEPNFLNIIRTNEVSVKVRDYFENLGESDFDTANAIYIDNKYILNFPGRREAMVYDRERGSWIGPWKFPFGINNMKRYFDDTGTERWVIGSSESNQVYTFDANLNTDDGTAIIKVLRTNKEYFKDWTILNIIKFFYVLLRNITGTVTVNILAEGRDGSTTTVKTFTITGSEVAGKTGWGMTKWGLSMWGISTGTTIAVGDEITRWGPLFKQARLVQTEVTSISTQSNFELLNVKMTASKMTEGSLSSGQRV